MPLFIDDTLITVKSRMAVEDVLKSFHKLRERSSHFISDVASQKISLKKSDRTLYVLQREFATISKRHNKQNFGFIASDDATTCHIVVLIERTSCSICLAHFDGSGTKEGIRSMLGELKDIVGKAELIFDLFIFGGFIDRKKYSEKIFSELLSGCIDLNESIHLQLACTHSLNSTIVDDEYSPVIYGIAANIETCKLQIANTNYRGPDIILRQVKLMYAEKSSMEPIYDFKSCVVYIKPFRFHTNPYAQQLLQLPDCRYLELMSTSPHCEPTHFVMSSKSALLFTLTHVDHVDKLFRNKDRNYELNQQNEWTLLDHDQLRLTSFTCQ